MKTMTKAFQCSATSYRYIYRKLALALKIVALVCTNCTIDNQIVKKALALVCTSFALVSAKCLFALASIDNQIVMKLRVNSVKQRLHHFTPACTNPNQQ